MTTVAWGLCREWTGEGSETKGREGYSRSTDERVDRGGGKDMNRVLARAGLTYDVEDNGIKKHLPTN